MDIIAMGDVHGRSFWKLEIVANRYFFIDTMDSTREYLILNEEGVRIDKVI